MKGKVITFRPRADLRERLERLALATGHKLTFHIEKCIEGHLPELETRYAEDLREHEKKRAKRPILPGGLELNEHPKKKTGV